MHFTIYRMLEFDVYSLLNSRAFRKQQLPGASERWLHRVWKSFGDLLGVLAQLDEIVRCHPVLQEHWKIYQKTMKMVQHNPSQFDAMGEKFKSLTNIIANLDVRVMSGYLFQVSF